MDCCWQNIKEHKHIQPSKTKSPPCQARESPVSSIQICAVFRVTATNCLATDWSLPCSLINQKRTGDRNTIYTIYYIYTIYTIYNASYPVQSLLIGNQNEKQSALSCWVVLQTSELLRLQPGFCHFLSVLLECLLNIILLYKVSNIVGIHPDSKHKQYRIQYLSGLRQRRGNEWNFLENISNTGLLWPPWMLLLCWPALQQRINTNDPVKISKLTASRFLDSFCKLHPKFQCTCNGPLQWTQYLQP